MKKKLIIITSIAGFVGFLGMFAFAWFTKPERPSQSPQAAQTAPVAQGANANTEIDKSQTTAAIRDVLKGGAPGPTTTDQQLQTLIYEVREKIQEYNLKLRGLDVREKRLQAAQDTLKKDIEEMRALRLELASAVVSLKNEQDKLLKSKVEIEKNETANLVSIAATYDKMDAESAAKILMNMVKSQNSDTGSDDAVKILYYMTERTKAKVLASMAGVEPAASAYICQKLKRMITKE
jgi:flagellar motility protein MotE (MotC chaperone)